MVNIRSTFEWPELKAHFESQMQKAIGYLVTCPLEEVQTYRGRVLVYRELLNLPHTFAVLSEDRQP